MTSIIGMFSWLRSDISDNRTEAAADRRDIMNLMRSIQEEMKDFHGRLCAIEEKKKGGGMSLLLIAVFAMGVWLSNVNNP